MLITRSYMYNDIHCSSFFFRARLVLLSVKISPAKSAELAALEKKKGRRRKRPVYLVPSSSLSFFFSRVHSLICWSFLPRAVPQKKKNKGVKSENIPNDYRSQYDWTIRFYLLIDHRIILFFHTSSCISLSLFLRDALTRCIPVFCLITDGIRLVFSSPGDRSFLLLVFFVLFLLSLFLFESVSYLPPKFLPDKREVVYKRDHHCQLRGTGSWQLISSSDHSRMNRSTWATMLTVSLWVADYERIISVLHTPKVFFFFFFYSMFVLLMINFNNICITVFRIDRKRKRATIYWFSNFNDQIAMQIPYMMMT